MNSNYRPTPSGWAIILFGVAALALGGCGRKGGLDLPPTAPSGRAARRSIPRPSGRRSPGVFNPTYGSEAAPAASKGSKKPFVLDPLLGN